MMNIIQNPVPAMHRASSRCPAFVEGILPKINSTTIRVYGQNVGEVVGDVFIKYVKMSRHFFKKHNGWCFNVSTLYDSLNAGARWVELREQEMPQTFRAAIATIFDEGIKDVDEGHGKQLCLPLKDWSRGDEPYGEQQKLWEE